MVVISSLLGAVLGSGAGMVVHQRAHVGRPGSAGPGGHQGLDDLAPGRRWFVAFAE
jgi:hypothetical protein